jgi:hypothetical protein
MPLTPFPGNCPRNVNRDAKYAVRYADGEMKVTIVYRHPNGEQWLASTGEHPELVEMVNRVKRAVSGIPAGPSYVNEFHQVLVPGGDEGQYFVAGEYRRPLEFQFEGHTLSGNGKGLDGRALTPGEAWEGPHPGIPYVATAALDDVYYEEQPRPDVRRKVRLSGAAGAARAREVAQSVGALKGGSGRFYINEFSHVFAPVSRTLPVQYVYVGRTDLELGWFPKMGNG